MSLTELYKYYGETEDEYDDEYLNVEYDEFETRYASTIKTEIVERRKLE